MKTRFCPSPTGMLHLGNARTALFNALLAQKEQGIFLLRIEDTDQSRSEIKHIDLLQHDLRWLNIHWNEGPDVGGNNGPYWQSQRHAIYDNYYHQLEKAERVYPCFCTDQELALNRKIQLSRGQAPRYPGTCAKLTAKEINDKLANGLKPALRFKVPAKTKIEFTDLIKGTQVFQSDDIGDFIIRRADGSSSFMFCNAIDDSLMGVTCAIRGEDHLTNTPRQLMILQALNLRAPEYGHLSLITGDDGTPLSKRHGSFSVNEMREQGFLPIALGNYMARLSHTYDSQKLLSFTELSENFQINRLSRSPTRFDMNQLLHWQKEAVMTLDVTSAWQWLGDEIKAKVPTAMQNEFVEMMRHNILFPKEAAHWAKVLFNDSLLLTADQIAILKEAGKDFFAALLTGVEQHNLDIKAILNQVKNQCSVSGKQLFMPVRIALTGEQHGPELLHIVNLLGKEKVRKRFHHALDLAGT
ncbi:glutamate--tRNA ligase [Gammaproteobacteria bacterium SCGC AG-212-F23]|nr:glutamate--tRNA ligase [Gammaproteobacteria bacterium SCGC AG-212-F23]